MGRVEVVETWGRLQERAALPRRRGADLRDHAPTYRGARVAQGELDGMAVGLYANRIKEVLETMPSPDTGPGGGGPGLGMTEPV